MEKHWVLYQPTTKYDVYTTWKSFLKTDVQTWIRIETIFPENLSQ